MVSLKRETCMYFVWICASSKVISFKTITMESLGIKLLGLLLETKRSEQALTRKMPNKKRVTRIILE